jgi:penicillin-binding protein 2
MLKFNPEIEPHEVLLDKLAKKKEEELGISEKKFETPIFKRNLLIFFSILFILVFILYSRTVYLQIVKGEDFLLQAQSNKYILAKIQAERGVIYDQNFKQLVFNVPKFDLILEKENLPKDERERKRILKEISQILKIDISELEKKIESKEPKVKIFENLDNQTVIMLETKIDRLNGFSIEISSKRQYLDGENFSHLLGYLGKIEKEELENDPDFYTIFDFTGKEGIEKSYEKVLRKNPGKILIERDAKGNVISKKIISLPKSGKSIVLWLDSDLQKKIKEELEKKIKEVGAKGGAAVAINPQTGGILSLVSLPSFDNNIFSEEISQEKWQELQKNPKNPFLNRATSGQYLLGSTIKPFLAIGALQEKIISPQKKINCQGKIEIPHQYNPEIVYTFGDWTVHGLTDIRKAIAESCNVFFYTIGGGYGDQEGLGPSRIKKYLELFGFGEIVNSDFPIPSFAKGILPDPEWKKKTIGENWWDGDTYNLSIGQGYILATPLQVARAYAAIANGGKILKPKFVWKIVDSEKNLIEEIKPEVEKENFLDPKNLQIVKEGMRWAVTGQNSPHASALALNDLPVAVAAKTGTAQVPKKDCPDCYNIWISVFAPYEDPKIVLTIMLEDVRGRLSGVVVPVAKEILNWYFSK